MAPQKDVRRIAIGLPETSKDPKGFQFFSEPHYDGYPAILVRLPAIDLELLEKLLTDAWRSRAPGPIRRRASG